jgi:hypothetical protein
MAVKDRSRRGVFLTPRVIAACVYALSVMAALWFLVFPALIRFIKPSQTTLPAHELVAPQATNR